MKGKPPLISMVLQWFFVSKTIGGNGFPMVFGPKTIGSTGISDGFLVQKPLLPMVFQWFCSPATIGHDGFSMVYNGS